MRTKRRFLGILLAACMVLMLLPMTAFAVGTMYFEVTVNGNTTQYETAGEAYLAVESALPSGGSATIKLLEDYSGGGLIVKANKNLDLTFDLNDKTWTVTDTVGSPGTETNAFQLNRGNTVTFQNGAVTSSVARILFQSYCDLTVDNVDVTLTTTTPGSYVMSNNNASTIIKGGSKIEATAAGNYAMDSFTFSDYDGGDVIIQDAEIIGNVEIANGGKMKLDGGTIQGNVTVYNYSYDSNVTLAPSFTMESGTVTGDVATSELGGTSINGGEVKGEVTLNTNKQVTAGTDGTAAVTIAGGIFAKLGDNIDIAAKDAAVLTKGSQSRIIVGLNNINEVLKEAGEGVTLQITKAAEGSKIEAPVGVVIKNESGNAVVVNGEQLANNASVTVEEKTEPTPSATPEATPSDQNDNPKTGDQSNLMLWMILLVASGIGVVAAAVYGRKKLYNK